MKRAASIAALTAMAAAMLTIGEAWPSAGQAGTGTLRVTIKPDELARQGVRWTIQTKLAMWRQSGEALAAPAGTYTLKFDGFDEGVWDPPAQQRVRVVEDDTTSVVATFKRKARAAERTRESMEGVVESHLSEVEDIYDEFRQQFPDLEGRLTVRWVIAENGTPSHADRVRSTTKNERFEMAVLARARRWQFGFIDGSEVTTFEYTFTFSR